MPVATPQQQSAQASVPATTKQQQQPANAELFKFEVSAPQVFHFAVRTQRDQVQVQVGAGPQLSKQLAVPIPAVVQSAATSVYGFTAPYVQWGYAKVVGVAVPKQA